jgi:hypothetical protein
VRELSGQGSKKLILSSGILLWISGGGKCKIKVDTPISWRRNLDYWMNQKAKDRNNGQVIWYFVCLGNR